ncbi:hypothetical protein M758_5G023500 [Ceratodon purpureus]|nr:hypothetical protein M758_5G023500 [Ceratodon purpureus]
MLGQSRCCLVFGAENFCFFDVQLDGTCSRFCIRRDLSIGAPLESDMNFLLEQVVWRDKRVCLLLGFASLMCESYLTASCASELQLPCSNVVKQILSRFHF